MENAYWIVVDDPRGEWDEGSVVGAERSLQLRARGACLLPFDPDLARRCGVGGYMRRGWGAGYPVDSPHPRMHCPLSVYATPNHAGLHWAARLVGSPEVMERVAQLAARKDAMPDTGVVGQLKIAADPSQGLANIVAVEHTQGAVAMKTLGTPDERGGWTIGGVAEARIPTEAVYGFALYGWAPGLRVAWAAVTIVAKVSQR